jgi:uncharacterized protein YciI
VSPRFAYFYLMRDDPDAIRIAVPKHVSYWRGLRLDGYLGGPFEDRTGGLITFETDEPGGAEMAVAEDPFVREGLLSAYWVKEWTPE